MHQLTPQDIPEIDSWLETLFQCKQLDEEVIRKLCEKVIKNLSAFLTLFLGERDSNSRI